MISFLEHGCDSLFLCLQPNHDYWGVDKYADDDISDLLNIFSPKIMKWDEHSWIVDLTATKQYWISKVNNHEKFSSLEKLITEILDLAFDFNKEMPMCSRKDDIDVVDISQLKMNRNRPYRVTIAATPWRGILLLNALKARGTLGVVTSSSHLGVHTIKNTDWDTVWSTFEQYIVILKNKGVSKLKMSAFNRDLKTFKLAISRLNIQSPYDLKSIDEVQVGRRFGELCSTLWNWTRMYFHSLSASKKTIAKSSVKTSDSSEFLWVSYLVSSSLRVTSHLDFTATGWSEIEEYLRIDLSRLCRLDGWGSEDKVVCLEWSVITDEADVCPIQINFRMPHHMRGEDPHHKTALRQAHHNFDKLDYYISDFNPFKARIMLDQSDDESQVSYDEQMPAGIVGWHLEVKERIIVPGYVRSLFGIESSCESLTSIINRFKVDAFSYDLQKDWLPEDSFQKKRVELDLKHQRTRRENEKKSDNDQIPYLLSDFKRPLFIYESPQQTSDPEGELVFLERTLDKWWKKVGAGYRRDYYMNYTSEGKLYWLYRDLAGRWFKHGIFS